MWEYMVPGTELNHIFVPGSARYSSALCLFFYRLIIFGKMYSTFHFIYKSTFYHWHPTIIVYPFKLQACLIKIWKFFKWSTLPSDAVIIFDSKHCNIAFQFFITVSACEWEQVKLSCEGKERIHIVNAFYGRLDGTTCSTVKSRRTGEDVDIGERYLRNTSCTSETATSTLSRRCDGKKKCRVGINNYVLGDPCVGTFKYSDVHYICLGDYF